MNDKVTNHLCVALAVKFRQLTLPISNTLPKPGGTMLPLLLSAFLLQAATYASAAQDTSSQQEARAIWLQGYQTFEEARKAEEEGQREDAGRMYRQALAIFENIHTQFPEWQPELISYRIEFCHKKLRQLKATSNQKRQALPRSELLALIESHKAEKHQAEETIRELQNKLKATSGALQNVRNQAGRNAEGEKKAVELVQRNNTLSNKIENKEAEIRQLAQQISDLRRSSISRKEYDTLQNKLQIRQAYNAQLAKEIEPLKAKLKNQQRLIIEAQNRNQKLVEEKKAVVPQLQEAEKRAHAAEARIKQAQAKLNEQRHKWRESEEKYQKKVNYLQELSGKAGKQLRAANRRIEELEIKMAEKLEQKDAIKACRQLIKRLKKMASQAENKDHQIGGQQETIDELRRDLQARDKTITQQQLALVSAQQDINRLAKIVNVLKKNENELAKKLQAVSQENTESGSLADKLDKTTEKQQKIIAALEEENSFLTGKAANQAELLGSQEHRIATLENTVASLKAKLKKPAAQKPHAGTYTQTTDKHRENNEHKTAGKSKDNEIAQLLRQGIEAEHKKNMQKAISFYSTLLKKKPDHKLALQRLGDIHLQKRKYQRAASVLNRAFKLDPDDLDTLLPLGHALVRLEKADLAVSVLSRAVALRPDNPVLHRTLGVACSSLGWEDAARVQFKRALAIDPEDQESAFNLALLYIATDIPALEKARKWYRRAIELGAKADPALEKALNNKLKKQSLTEQP
ncbi:MAG: tetratricopeptide repeat protein [Lentisphaeria bacterium]